MLALLILASAAGALYFHLGLHTDIIYTHFMYVPIVLACLWWGWRGMAVAGLLGLVVVLFQLTGVGVGAFWNDAARVLFFGLVAFFIAWIKEKEESGKRARKQEEQLEHSTRLAELGEMAAAIAHELNQPLTGIRNYARNAFYMLDKAVGSPEEVKGNLRLISEQVDRAAKIINQMRELTRRSDRHFGAVDINGVVRESVEFLLPQMKLSQVEVQLDLARELPDIQGDRIRLAQVFLNLLANARQAMEGSPVRQLRIRSYRAPGPGEAVMVEIADTGKGFSPEVGTKLFVPFFTTKKSGHGTGLGLSISRSILKDHQGTIEARGEEGRGALFVIRLPLTPAEAGGGPAAGGDPDGSSAPTGPAAATAVEPEGRAKE